MMKRKVGIAYQKAILDAGIVAANAHSTKTMKLLLSYYKFIKLLDNLT